MTRATGPRKPREIRVHFIPPTARDNTVCGAVAGAFSTREPDKVTCPKCLPTAKREFPGSFPTRG